MSTFDEITGGAGEFGPLDGIDIPALEYIGNIAIPRIPFVGLFPITPDYGYGFAQDPHVIVHQFASGNAKIEQRFYDGMGTKRYLVRKAALNESDRIALRDFWESCYGPYGSFTYNVPRVDRAGFDAVLCRFANEPLSWEQLSDSISSTGVTLIEMRESWPVYTIASTVQRYPSGSLETALLDQVQEIIPLIKVQPREVSYPAIYLSDRRCTVGSFLYQPRLVQFGGISQGINGESDEAQFVFGNADRVMRDLANDANLFRASIELSLYHVATGIKIDLWKGELKDWTIDAGPDFNATASNGVYELTLPYPCRRISRTCWKMYNDSNGCPYATQSTGLDTTHFPSASALACDKSYDSANGCLAHGMKRYFGGIIAKPQTMKLKLTNGKVANFGSSLVVDSIYDSVIPEIYCNNPSYVDEAGTTKYGYPVNCKLAMGRDESSRYQALGIVGEGPITINANAGSSTLDGMSGITGGVRIIPGNDPAGSGDYLSLSVDWDSTEGSFRKVYTGGKTYDDNFSAGTAAVVIKRNDDAGIQLAKADSHTMEVIVAYGQQGWIWTATGSRTWGVLTNPIWIVINILLKALGLKYASASVAEQYFVVDSAVAAAAICDTSVAKIIGSGNETQFSYQGILSDERPLKDWIQDILNTCLGYYSWTFGKLDIGIRYNSSVAEAFTDGNILFKSLSLAPIKPGFNYLTGSFKDQEYKFADNSVQIYDEDHAKFIGGATAPLYNKANISLIGAPGKSQVARIVTTRLREELGGITAAQRRDARMVNFKTTVLALSVNPGMVCSMTNTDMPAGVGEFRAIGWRLNSDYSIDISGRTTVDEMYDLTTGIIPADVEGDRVPVDVIINESPYALYGDLGTMATEAAANYYQASYIDAAIAQRAEAAAITAGAITIPKLTPGGTDGSITFSAQGVVTAYTPPT